MLRDQISRYTECFGTSHSLLNTIGYYDSITNDYFKDRMQRFY